MLLQQARGKRSLDHRRTGGIDVHGAGRMVFHGAASGAMGRLGGSRERFLAFEGVAFGRLRREAQAMGKKPDVEHLGGHHGVDWIDRPFVDLGGLDESHLLAISTHPDAV